MKSRQDILDENAEKFNPSLRVISYDLDKMIEGAMLDYAEPLIKVINGLLDNPEGCPMCDSGKLRNPQKEHWDKCPYKIATDHLIKYKNER